MNLNSGIVAAGDEDLVMSEQEEGEIRDDYQAHAQQQTTLSDHLNSANNTNGRERRRAAPTNLKEK